MNKEKQKSIPELRFPEFSKDEYWNIKPLKKVFSIFQGYSFSSKDSVEEGTRWLKIADVSIQNMKHNNPSFLPYDYTNIYEKFLIKKGDYVLALTRPILNGKLKISAVDDLLHNSLLNQRVGKLVSNENLTLVYYLLQTNYLIEEIEKSIAGSEPPNLSMKQIENIPISLPSNPKEQQKIAYCLSSLDNLITAETQKLNLLKDHKKGLLQQLFPANGETKPQFRFPEFENDGDWIETILENCLDYLQPTPYLVSSTDYEDKFKTPVLTAGKTFILGYTDEKEGIFNKNLPVIIFDDFTTATKFVDFPFKAKSSAMKILLAKDDNNIQFLYETIQNLSFEVSTHKRHWISVYSKLDILKPKDPKEQQKIANCLSSSDDLIEAQTIKIEALKEHKKGLMQQLFPNSI